MSSFTYDPSAVESAAEITRFPVQHVVHDADKATEAVETWAEGEVVAENETAVSQIEAAVAGENVQTLELQPDQIAQLLSGQGGILKLDDGTTIGGQNSEQVVYYMHVPWEVHCNFYNDIKLFAE